MRSMIKHKFLIAFFKMFWYNNLDESDKKYNDEAGYVTCC
jgi:hypothetical protein